MFELLIWWVFVARLHFRSFMACLWTLLWMLYFMQRSGKWVSEIHMLLDTYLHGHVMAWGWVRWQCCGMPVLCQSIWLQCHRESNHIPIHFLPVLPLVFRKEYGLVSCKPFSWYTPSREAGMRVPWPWIKARHPVRGHGCFRLGPRGGHALERAYRNLIPCYSRLWPPRLKVFLGRCLGWLLGSWGEMGVYW